MSSSLIQRRLLVLAVQRDLSQRAACRLLWLSRRVAYLRLRQPGNYRPVGVSSGLGVVVEISPKRVPWPQLEIPLASATSSLECF